MHNCLDCTYKEIDQNMNLKGLNFEYLCKDSRRKLATFRNLRTICKQTNIKVTLLLIILPKILKSRQKLNYPILEFWEKYNNAVQD